MERLREAGPRDSSLSPPLLSAPADIRPRGHLGLVGGRGRGWLSQFLLLRENLTSRNNRRCLPGDGGGSESRFGTGMALILLVHSSSDLLIIRDALI